MTPNQRDLFLYQWSRSRKKGRLGTLVIGAGIGALGGIVFAWILSSDISSRWEEVLRLYAISIPTFAGIGAFGIDRVFRSQEAMYQNFLQQGAEPPPQKPVLRQAERWPQYMVYAAAAIIAGFIAVVWVMYG